MKVLLFDNNDSFTYNLAHLLKEAGVKDLTIMKSEAIHLGSISSFDKIVISPGPGIPTESPGMMELIETYKHKKSLMGVCLGFHAIACSFGAKLYNLPLVAHGIRMDTVVQKEDYLFHSIPEYFIAGLYHSWAIDELGFPDCLEITARAKNGIIMAFRHRNLDLRGVQFHPESYMTEYGLRMIQNWIRH